MPIIPIIIPKIGESVDEATITDWLKQVGDPIAKDEFFVEITTDKVTSELPSEYEGVLSSILVQENQMVKIGESIGELEVSEAVFETFKNNQSTFSSVTQTRDAKVVENQIIKEKELGTTFLSPVVRKIAKEHHLSISDLEKIPTSGNQGRLTKKDVLKYLKLTPSEDNFSTSKKLDLPISMEDTVKPMVGIRKKAAAILEQSYREIPHVTTIVEVDVTAMVAQRNTEKKKFFEEYGLKLTYTHYCFYALLQALKKYPALNSWYNQDEWIWKKAVNLGFATSLPDDILVVPNIQNASNLSFHELVSQINSKAQKAKENKLQASDFENTTITVSNTGIFGSLMGTPIISKPQVCVLALGEIRDHFSYNEKQEFIKSKKMHLSMSYDHRVINGAIASKFLSEVKQQLSESNI